MKLAVVCLLSSLVASAVAAPAVVWKKTQNQNQNQNGGAHLSDNIAVGDLLKNVFDESSSTSSSWNVIFLVGKGQDGSESLSEWTSQGKLPRTAEQYQQQEQQQHDTTVYHHVSGVESSATMVRDARAAVATEEDAVLAISIPEWTSKLASLDPTATVTATAEQEDAPATATATATAGKKGSKRARQLKDSNLNTFVVNIYPTKDDAAEVDRIIAKTIGHAHVDTVILSGVRSIHEVKHERMLASRKRRHLAAKEGQQAGVVAANRRRRLEQQDQQQDGDANANDDANNNNNNNNNNNVYYVAMTPNILAGILFMGLFTVITWIGISCMGAISGQDVFVSKMPTVGREA